MFQFCISNLADFVASPPPPYHSTLLPRYLYYHFTVAQKGPYPGCCQGVFDLRGRCLSPQSSTKRHLIIAPPFFQLPGNLSYTKKSGVMLVILIKSSRVSRMRYQGFQLIFQIFVSRRNWRMEVMYPHNHDCPEMNYQI